MKKTLLTALMASMMATGFSQKIKSINPGSIGTQSEYLEFDPTSAPTFNNKAIIIDRQQQIHYEDAVNITKEIDLAGGFTYRLQQVLNNIPVENAIYISHVKNGRVISQNGKWFQISGDIAALPSISESNALNQAKLFVNATQYKWEIPGEEAFIKSETGNPNASFFPKGKLVYINAEKDDQMPVLTLAYKFDIYAQEPLSRKWIYVDAFNGKIISSEDQIHETNATGTAVTAYSGTQTITTDSYNGSYRLRETGRGNGIQTFNMKAGTNYNTAVDFTDTDNNWNNVNTAKDQYATDAHWGAEKTYDFYQTNFARNSIDNAGFLIKSYVHYSRNYFNAFWDGSRMTYGDGSATYGNKPLTAIDVCGHEITHGLTSFTAKLNYSNESGALNEGFSDIFGTAIEWYARPTKCDWLIGADFYTIRSMSNPKAYSQPKTYLKQYWYTGTADNGGVHTNSGVINYWFYLLSAGGSGTNDNSFVFNVSGIGIAKAQAIAYRTLTTYLVPTSNYANARTYSIKSAEDLYGFGSNEALQTKNAWDACGVGGGLSAAGRATFAKNSAADVYSNSIFPNPATTNTTLTFNAGVSQQKSELQVVDINGNSVMKIIMNVQQGTNTINLNLPENLSPGKYWIRLNGKTMNAFIKE